MMMMVLMVVVFMSCSVLLVEGQTCAANKKYPNSYTHCVGLTCGGTTPMIFRIISSSSLTSSSSSTSEEIVLRGDLPLTVGCTCDPLVDIGARFTQCDNSTNTKSAFYFYKPPAVCTGYELPTPISGLPCDLVCEEGTRLDVNSKKCLHCEPGSYAHSGELSMISWTSTGLDLDTNTESPVFPPQMRSYCSNYAWSSACSPWQPRGDYVDSGNNRGKNFAKNYLEFYVEISQLAVDSGNASVSFEYQVDAEQFYDFFFFGIDSTQDFLMRADQQLTWKKQTFKFNKAGFHTLIWAYIKDSSKDEGEDRAKVRNIVINGSVDKEVVLRCELCPKGSASDGTVPCQKCQPGTYADEEGLDQCKPCAPGKTSFSGSTDCFLADIPCTSADYSYRYGSTCENDLRTMEYFWVSPIICNASNPDSAPLPALSNTKCSETLKCPLGMKKSIQGNIQSCVYCEPGSFNDHDNRNNNETETDTQLRSIQHAETECEACQTNEASKYKVVHIYDVVAGISSPYVSSCTGECMSAIGWRDLGAVGLDSGTSNGKSVAKVLFQNMPTVSMEEDVTPYFSTRLFLSCPANSGNRVDFLIDGVVRKSVFCGGCIPFEQDENEIEEDWMTVDVPLTLTERKKLPLTFEVYFVSVNPVSTVNDTYNCDRAVISKVSLYGVANQGGAVVCKTCAGGKYPLLDECKDCAAGSYSPPGSASCGICNANQFSYNASDRCYDCGEGQTSAKGSQACSWKGQVCENTHNVGGADKTFNMNKFSELLGGARFYNPTILDASFYFDICKNPSSVNLRSNIFNFQEQELYDLIKPLNSMMEVGEYASVCPANSYACIRYRNGQVVDFGNSLSMTPILDSHNVGVNITLRNYQNVCYNNVTGRDGPSMISVIAMCTTDSATESSLADSPRIVATDDSRCNFRLETLSIHGCPLCTESNFNRLEGECSSETKTRTIRYARKEGLVNKCARGDGDLTNVVKTEACEPLSITAPYWIVAIVLVVGLVIVIGISIVAVFLYFKYRSMAKKYYSQIRDDDTTNQTL
ncbi:hypothetical protein NAEGRDRAFT_78118 [Naegleria gruberi]|uniref:Tyrosine-protein kinase ephrin type A/B receptor-like domain-containing protein n=1 Tax=Naegleria gruberi TaxID=5762 RepID=D2V140_NAEGR|nr:uncharacterized protein NAEGRDRAFT_78118 [Naegleria gruberi]EFC49624.1 hypothetical protein NAEGRDRAFT_78118 [Naegleria gruberi]|eukprot:XP_002682368.1 hypothetical protein NAEGRDRAFT_78118 [Naegleria gruberi strain NEG-M]